MLEALRQANVSKVLFSSSCTTYGIPIRSPINEDHPLDPISAYGRSKLMVEMILRDYDRAYGLRHVALRYFNAAGADIEGEIGERHEPDTRAIPLAIKAACEDGEVFSIFGDDFDTSDGTAVRDYVHVTDLAHAHAKALGYLQTGGRSEVFNLGTGVGVSVRQILSAVETVVGAPVRHTVGPRREGDPACLVAAAEKARTVLGWEPRHSHLDEIVRTAWRWHRLDRIRGLQTGAA